MKLSRTSLATIVVIGFAALLLSCGGGSDEMTNSSGGGMVQLRVSATGVDTMLSSIPADAWTTARTGAGVTITNKGQRTPTRPTSGHDDSGDGGSGDRPNLQSFEITFARIEARNSDGVLVPLVIALPFIVDVLSLNGRSIELPIGVLPAGTYRGFDVTISKVSLLLEDGTRITIDPPEGGFTTAIRTATFTVVDGQATTVTLRLRADRALRWLGHAFGFDPVFDGEVDDGPNDGHGASGGDDDADD